MSSSWALAAAAFAAVLAGGPSPPVPTPNGTAPPAATGCPSIGNEERGTVTGPTMFRLGDGVEAMFQVADDGWGDAGDTVMHFEMSTNPFNDQPPLTHPGEPELKWSVDGGPWHTPELAYISGLALPTWTSADEPAPAIRPKAFRTMRIWLALHGASVAGHYFVQTMFGAPACGVIGTGRPVTFTYYPQGLGHPSPAGPRRRPTAAPTSHPPSPPAGGTPTDGPVPSVAPPPPRARAASNPFPTVLRGAGTAVAAALVLVALVQWRRGRRDR